MKKYRNRKFLGFTLIELLVAVAIIGILSVASIGLINPGEQLRKGRDAQRRNDLEQIQKALDFYHTDNNKYPLSNASNLIEDKAWGSEWLPYLAKIPKDPIDSQSYRYESDGKSYSLFAKLERCNDPQIVVSGDCNTAQFNFGVASSNIAVVPFAGPTITSAPTPTFTPTPTNTPIPTSTPTPTPSYRRVFVTSGRYTGDLKTEANNLTSLSIANGLDGGDKICQWLADRATPSPLGGSWKAWLSDNTISPATPSLTRPFTKSSVPYLLVDNTIVVADNWTDLISINVDSDYLQNPISKDENNTNVSLYTDVWTGTNVGGGKTGYSCLEWTNSLSSGSGSFGYNTFKTNLWTNYGGGTACDNNFRLYCFEQ